MFSWYTTERLVSPAPPLPKQTTSVPEPNEDVETEEESFTHTQVQWKLAQIGKKLGCRVWIAANDHNKQWNGHRLGDLSEATLPSLGMDPVSRKIISLIDVLWIKGFNQVVAAFEVEHTTSIYSGLLRMSDLTTVSPNLNVPLYIVTSQQRIDKVQRELSRPTFQMLELHKQCSFFSYELLMQEAENIMKWASDSTAIDNLAQKVDDVNYEDGI